jgi:hypothetical protein
VITMPRNAQHARAHRARCPVTRTPHRRGFDELVAR